MELNNLPDQHRKQKMLFLHVLLGVRQQEKVILFVLKSKKASCLCFFLAMGNRRFSPHPHGFEVQ